MIIVSPPPTSPRSSSLHSHSFLCFSLYLKNSPKTEKQKSKQTNEKKIREKKITKRNKNPTEKQQNIVCATNLLLDTRPACPGVWLVSSVTLPLKNWFFFLLPKDNVLVRGEIFCPFSLASDGHLTPEYELSICILSLDIHQTVSIKIVIFPYFHHESSILELFKMKRNQNFYFCNWIKWECSIQNLRIILHNLHKGQTKSIAFH